MLLDNGPASMHDCSFVCKVVPVYFVITAKILSMDGLMVLCITCFRWEELISLTKQRKQLLKGAEQVHKFVRDASETNDRMNEKVSPSIIIT